MTILGHVGCKCVEGGRCVGCQKAIRTGARNAVLTKRRQRCVYVDEMCAFMYLTGSEKIG